MRCGLGCTVSGTGVNFYNNGVGILDTICETLYCNNKKGVAQVRNFKVIDLVGKGYQHNLKRLKERIIQKYTQE